MGATLGDTLRAYIKPSLDGLIVLRKRTSNQVSPRVQASKDRVAKYLPSVEASGKCISDGKSRKVRIYKPGKGYEEKDVCPIKLMKPYLRRAMKAAHGRA